MQTILAVAIVLMGLRAGIDLPGPTVPTSGRQRPGTGRCEGLYDSLVHRCGLLGRSNDCQWIDSRLGRRQNAHAGDDDGRRYQRCTGPIFIFGWGPRSRMGLGAAIATVIARMLGMVFVFYILV